MIYLLHGRHGFSIYCEKSARLTSCLPDRLHVWTYQRALCPHVCVLTFVSSHSCHSYLCHSYLCPYACRMVLMFGFISVLCVLTFVSSPLCLHLCVLTFVSSPLCPRLCVLAFVSSPLCPRLCVLAFVSSPLCPRLCVLAVVSSPLCPRHCVPHICRIVLIFGPISMPVPSLSVILLCGNTFSRSSTPFPCHQQCYSSIYKRSHFHSAISFPSILSAKTTIPINNGYHQSNSYGFCASHYF